MIEPVICILLGAFTIFVMVPFKILDWFLNGMITEWINKH